MSNIQKKAAGGVFSLGTANIFSQVVTWVFTILIARLLRPEDYGLVSMAAVYIGFAEFFNEFGIGAAIVQKHDLSTEQLRATYTLSLLLGLFFTCISLPAAHLLAVFFKEPRLIPIVYVLAITFLISATKNVQMNLMTKRMHFKKIARIEVIARISSSLTTYACAYFGMGYWALVVMYLSYNLYQTILYLFSVHIAPGRVKSFDQVRGILSFGGRVMLSRIINYLTLRTDTLIIGKIIGANSLGIYSLALSLGNKPVDKIMYILNRVFFPILSQVKNEKDKLRGYVLKIFEMEFFIILPIFILLLFSAEDLLPMILGQRWNGVVFPFTIFVSVAVFIYMRARLSVIIMAIGKPEYGIYFSLVSLFTMSPAMIILGYLFQLKGVLMAWVFVFPVLTLGFTSIVLKKINLDIITLFNRCKISFFITFLTGLFLFVVKYYFPYPGMSRMLTILFAGPIVYLLLFYVFANVKFMEILSLLKSRNQSSATA